MERIRELECKLSPRYIKRPSIKKKRSTQIYSAPTKREGRKEKCFDRQTASTLLLSCRMARGTPLQEGEALLVILVDLPIASSKHPRHAMVAIGIRKHVTYLDFASFSKNWWHNKFFAENVGGISRSSVLAATTTKRGETHKDPFRRHS